MTDGCWQAARRSAVFLRLQLAEASFGLPTFKGTALPLLAARCGHTAILVAHARPLVAAPAASGWLCESPAYLPDAACSVSSGSPAREQVQPVLLVRAGDDRGIPLGAPVLRLGGQTRRGFGPDLGHSLVQGYAEEALRVLHLADDARDAVRD